MGHILHSSTTEEDASGLRAIRLQPTNVNAYDSVGVESDGESSIDMDCEDFVGTVPSSVVEFVGRKDLEQYSFAVVEICSRPWDPVETLIPRPTKQLAGVF